MLTVIPLTIKLLLLVFLLWRKNLCSFAFFLCYFLIHVIEHFLKLFHYSFSLYVCLNVLFLLVPTLMTFLVSKAFKRTFWPIFPLMGTVVIICIQKYSISAYYAYLILNYLICGWILFWKWKERWQADQGILSVCVVAGFGNFLAGWILDWNLLHIINYFIYVFVIFVCFFQNKIIKTDCC